MPWDGDEERVMSPEGQDERERFISYIETYTGDRRKMAKSLAEGRQTREEIDAELADMFETFREGMYETFSLLGRGRRPYLYSADPREKALQKKEEWLKGYFQEWKKELRFSKSMSDKVTRKAEEDKEKKKREYQNAYHKARTRERKGSLDT